jgi:hypothetical protein
VSSLSTRSDGLTGTLLAGLEEALRHGGGTHTLGDVLHQILAGEAQLWEAEDAVIVTEIHQAPRAKIVHFWLAAGEKEAVVALSRTVLEWARTEGCGQATLAGRRGWERVLSAEGWTPRLTLMGREL